jgi:hypothetical protein
MRIVAGFWCAIKLRFKACALDAATYLLADVCNQSAFHQLFVVRPGFVFE